MSFVKNLLPSNPATVSLASPLIRKLFYIWVMFVAAYCLYTGGILGIVRPFFGGLIK